MSVLYHLGKTNVVGNALCSFSVIIIAHGEEEKRGLA